MRTIPLVLLLAGLALPARAQERPPELRQVLVDLAHVLGESHALRQVCEGPDDQLWRERMATLVEIEQPDPALASELGTAFNAGHAARRREFSACTAPGREAAAIVAGRGSELAGQLAQATRPVPYLAPPPEPAADVAPEGAAR